MLCSSANYKNNVLSTAPHYVTLTKNTLFVSIYFVRTLLCLIVRGGGGAQIVFFQNFDP